MSRIKSEIGSCCTTGSKKTGRSAIAHLYFESIHPFEDGNGRIGRVIAEKVLSQSLGRPILLSLSATIEADKKAYYHRQDIESHRHPRSAGFGGKKGFGGSGRRAQHQLSSYIVATSRLVG
jgi:fido (protein-threonine AMPylation protein)